LEVFFEVVLSVFFSRVAPVSDSIAQSREKVQRDLVAHIEFLASRSEPLD
jgi:hypothetical protein